MLHRKTLPVTSILAILITGLCAQSAFATYPGANGSIAWTSGTVGAANSRTQIWTMASNGTSPVGVTSGSGSKFDPKWNAKGSKILFYSSRSGEPGIWQMNGDGQAQSRILASAANADSQAVVTPDGSKIIFTSTRDGNDEIYSMNVDGSNPTRLTNNSQSDFDPAISPGGTAIAFASTRDGTSEIYKMNIDGSNQTRLTNSAHEESFDGSNYSPNWSPDGSKLVFESTRGSGDTEVYVMLADGSNQGALTNNTQEDTYPAWSPDGSKIVFSRGSIEPDIFNIHTMNADGSGDTTLTFGTYNVNPDWQPAPNTNLGVTVTPTTPAVFVTQDVTFNLSVANSGPGTANGVTLNGTLPAGLTLKSATPSTGTCTAGTLNCSVGSLASGATATVSVVATTSAVGTPAVSATATEYGPELSDTDNTASGTVNVQQDKVAPTASIVLPACKKNKKMLTGKRCTEFRSLRANMRTLQATITDPVPSLGGVSKGQFQFYREIKTKKKKRKAKKSAAAKKCVVYTSASKTKTVKCSDAKNVWLDGAAAPANNRNITHILKLAASPAAGKWVLRVRGIDASNNISSVFTKANQMTFNLKTPKKTTGKKKSKRKGKKRSKKKR